MTTTKRTGEESMFGPFHETGQDVAQRARSFSHILLKEAVVYGTGDTEPTNLDNLWQDEEHSGDYIVIVPCNRDGGGENLSTDDLARLAERWNVPGIIIASLLQLVNGDDLETTSSGVVWRSWTFNTPVRPEGIWVYHPCTIAIGFPIGISAASLRVLMFVNHGSLFNSASDVVRQFFTSDMGPPELRALWLRTMIMNTLSSTWRSCSEGMKVMAHSLFANLRDANKNVAHSSSISFTAEMNLGLSTNIVYIKSLSKLARALLSDARKLKLEKISQHIGLEIIESVSNFHQSLIEHLAEFTAIRDSVEYEREVCVLAIHTNSLNYVRLNLEQMNKITESSQTQAEQMHIYAEESRQGTRYMRRLALLTMVYLPFTTIAAIFCTPFLALDEDRNFKAVGKIWIFFIFSLALTSVTVATFMAWDTVSYDRSQDANEAAITPEKDDVQNYDDGNSLRPNHHADVDPSELLMKLSKRVNGSHRQEDLEIEDDVETNETTTSLEEELFVSLERERQD